MSSIEELRDRACRLRSDLETFRREMEGSGYPPSVKSTLARDIQESQSRVDDVIRICTPPAQPVVTALVTV